MKVAKYRRLNVYSICNVVILVLTFDISNMLFQFQYTIRNKILLQTHLLKSVFTFCHILFIDIFTKYIV